MSSSTGDSKALLNERKTWETALQKQVAFFDLNNDGVIYPWETFQGMRLIGANRLVSLVTTVLINATLSPSTRPGKFPSLLFPIEVANISLAGHGSGTGAFDKEGRFVAEKFEEIFTKYALTNPNSLTFREMRTMLKAYREPMDFKGWAQSFAEWMLLYYLCKDENGLLDKEITRASYDGSLFYQLAEKRASSRK